MKSILFFIILLVTTNYSWGQVDVLPDKESITGYEKSIQVEHAVKKFNLLDDSKMGPELKSLEIFDSIKFELGITHPNNNQELRKILLEILETKKLPKGSYIKNFIYNRGAKRAPLIYILLNLNKQPTDLVPAPQSANLVIKIPVRIIY